MSTESVDALAEVEAKISALAEAYLVSGKPYLLSRLGKDLGDDLRNLKLLTDQPLSHFVSERMGDRFSVVLTGPHSNIQALVRSASADDPPATNVSVPQSEAGPRYNYRFWAAFAVPLKDERRFLNMIDFTFDDGKDPPTHGKFVEIDPELIPEDTMPERDNFIRESISKWLTKNRLLAEHFMSKPRMQGEKASRPSTGRSVLEAVVESLDRKQLSGTSLSLDVVAELLRRRV